MAPAWILGKEDGHVSAFEWPVLSGQMPALNITLIGIRACAGNPRGGWEGCSWWVGRGQGARSPHTTPSPSLFPVALPQMLLQEGLLPFRGTQQCPMWALLSALGVSLLARKTSGVGQAWVVVMVVVPDSRVLLHLPLGEWLAPSPSSHMPTWP